MIVGRRFDGAVLGRECAAIHVTDLDRVIPSWLYAWTRTQDFRGQVEREVVGATIQRLTPRGLRGLSIPLLPLREQERVAAVAEAFDAALDAAKLAVSDLGEDRDRQLDLELYQRLERSKHVSKVIPEDTPRPRATRRPRNPQNINMEPIEPRRIPHAADRVSHRPLT